MSNWSSAFTLWTRWRSCRRIYNLRFKSWTRLLSRMSSCSSRSKITSTSSIKFRKRSCKRNMKLINWSCNKVKSTSNCKLCKFKSIKGCRVRRIRMIWFSKINSNSNRWTRIFSSSNSSKFSSKPPKQWQWEMPLGKLTLKKPNNNNNFNSNN